VHKYTVAVKQQQALSGKLIAGRQARQNVKKISSLSQFRHEIVKKRF
jgi:hypothetical protein